MKKVRQFREKVRTILQEKDREVYLRDADPLLYTNLGLESALLLLEQARKEIEQGTGLEALLRQFKNVFQANLICLEASQAVEETTSKPFAIVRYNDFQLSRELQEKLCRPTGLYGNLAAIRFTHQFENKDAQLKIAEAEGHPPVGSIAAVPTFRKNRPAGCLAATHEQGKFTEGYIMLLAVAAEIVSIVESR